MRAEVLIDETTAKPMNPRGKAMLRALYDADPTSTILSRIYRGTAKILVMYGVGDPGRRSLMATHMRNGGVVVCIDMGYWDKNRGAMRVAINAVHPLPEHIARSPLTPRRHFTLTDVANPKGPILLAGTGKKSMATYGQQHLVWERDKLRELRKRFPGHQVLWRPKGAVPTPLLDAPLRVGMPIEQAVQGCSLVVCRHSNVAVDACEAGVPVECEAGAAYALFRGNPAPTREQRADFLARLSHWNYMPQEAARLWKHVEMIANC